MIVGAFVLPDVIVGMIEASTTRKPSSPRSRNRSSTTAIGSEPILHVPHGWKIVVPIFLANAMRSSSVVASDPGAISRFMTFCQAGCEEISRILCMPWSSTSLSVCRSR